jgi:hypothetical protein
MSASAAARQPVPLRRGVLSSLPAGIRAPGYDVSAVRPGIVHLGLAASTGPIWPATRMS